VHDLDDAGHAMIIEKTGLVARTILAFLAQPPIGR
jgi:hypothetical protein